MFFLFLPTKNVENFKNKIPKISFCTRKGKDCPKKAESSEVE
jgi:hypothetical protein